MEPNSELESISDFERDGIPDLWRNRELPQRWHKQPSYSLRVAWLSTTPRPGTLEMMQEHAESLRREGKDARADELLQGISGHPGWWLHSNIAMDGTDSLEAAVKKACKTVIHSDFSAAGFLQPPTPAPVKPVKAQRKALVAQLEAGAITTEGLTREAFLEIAPGYALSVWIEDMSCAPEIETLFADEDNPLRSLETVWCVLSFTKYDGDGSDIAAGYVKLDGNTLHVGEWSQVFSADSEVEGSAFAEVSVQSEAEGGWYNLFSLSTPRTLEQLQAQMAADIEQDEDVHAIP